jgi:hypothetical protein
LYPICGQDAPIAQRALLGHSLLNGGNPPNLGGTQTDAAQFSSHRNFSSHHNYFPFLGYMI